MIWTPHSLSIYSHYSALDSVAIAAVSKVARDSMCNPTGGEGVKWEAAVKVQRECG